MDCLPVELIHLILDKYTLLKNTTVRGLVTVLTSCYMSTKAIVPGWVELYNRLEDWKTAIKIDSPGLLDLTTNLPSRMKLFNKATLYDSVRVFQWLHDKYGAAPCMPLFVDGKISELMKTLTYTEEACNYWLAYSPILCTDKLVAYMLDHNMKIRLTDSNLERLVYWSEWDLIDRLCKTGNMPTPVQHVIDNINYLRMSYTPGYNLYKVRFMEWIVNRDYSSTKLEGTVFGPSYYLEDVIPILRAREDVPREFLEELEQM